MPHQPQRKKSNLNLGFFSMLEETLENNILANAEKKHKIITRGPKTEYQNRTPVSSLSKPKPITLLPHTCHKYMSSHLENEGKEMNFIFKIRLYLGKDHLA